MQEYVKEGGWPRKLLASHQTRGPCASLTMSSVYDESHSNVRASTVMIDRTLNDHTHSCLSPSRGSTRGERSRLLTVLTGVETTGPCVLSPGVRQNHSDRSIDLSFEQIYCSEDQISSDIGFRNCYYRALRAFRPSLGQFLPDKAHLPPTEIVSRV